MCRGIALAVAAALACACSVTAVAGAPFAPAAVDPCA